MDIFEIIKKRIILTLQTQSFQFIDYSLTKVLQTLNLQPSLRLE